MSDSDLAATLAKEAGHILLALRDGGEFDAKDLGKAGDTQANDYLVRALLDARPDDGLLSEERACDGTRLGQSRVWIIDPVDGTREYGEGRNDWAVHVALAINGIASIGAVALPALNLVLRSDKPAPIQSLPARPRMVVSRTRPASEALLVAEALDAELIPMGSAGAKAMAVVRGEADIYLHTGGQYEWDSCAPVAVAAAHGLHVSRVDGSPLVYNQADTYMPDLLICRSEFSEEVLKLLRGISG